VLKPKFKEATAYKTLRTITKKYYDIFVPYVHPLIDITFMYTGVLETIPSVNFLVVAYEKAKFVNT